MENKDLNKQQITPNSRMYKRAPALIQKLIDLGFPISINLEYSAYDIDFFYKSKVLRLIEDETKDDVIHAYDKNGYRGIITDPEQIIFMNYEWYIASKVKNTYPDLDKFWENLFQERKWLNRVYILVPDLNKFEEEKRNFMQNGNEVNSTTTPAEQDKESETEKFNL